VQAIVFGPAKRQIRTSLRQTNETNRHALCIKHLHSIERLRICARTAIAAPAAPKIPFRINLEAIDGRGTVGNPNARDTMTKSAAQNAD